MKNKSKIFVLLSLCLLILQALTILGSWIVSAMWPSMGINSLLSGRGLRWFLGHMPENLSDTTLVWIILSCIIIGAFVWRELPKKIIAHSKNDYRERFAVIVFYLVVAISFLVCFAMAFFPHSSFLGVTGHLFPGPFLSAVFFIVGLGLSLGIAVYLMLSGKVDTYETVEQICVFGLQKAAPLIVIYLLLKELIEMIKFAL